MAAPGFRDRFNQERTARILKRVGDRATLEDGTLIMGTFENPFRDTHLGNKSGGKGLGAAVDASSLADPRFNVVAQDVARLPRGTIIAIELPPEDGGGRYRVLRPEPAGDGMVALLLEVARERTADIR